LSEKTEAKGKGGGCARLFFTKEKRGEKQINNGKGGEIVSTKME